MNDDNQSKTPHMGAEVNSGAAGTVPYRQIRAVYDDATIRVYQAYSDTIARPALLAGRFVAPFKRERMTWIKPSFLWMMYRAGWGYKEAGQQTILGIDIDRAGFEWALRHGCESHPDPGMSPEQWETHKNTHPVRVQWDPERNLRLEPLPYRSIQIGLGPQAVSHYVDDWICRIEDVTPLAHRIHALVEAGALDRANAALPAERPYPTPSGQ